MEMVTITLKPTEALLLRELCYYQIEDSGSFPPQIVTDTPIKAYQSLIDRLDKELSR